MSSFWQVVRMKSPCHVPQTVVINRSQMQSVYNLLILSQHVAAQLQTRHFECEKFLFKVVLLSSASIARANRFGSGRLCWTTCTNSTSSKASHKSEQKNANRKSNREQQIIIHYPTLSNFIQKLQKFFLDLGISWTGVNMGRISMSPIQKLFFLFTFLLSSAIQNR